MAAPMRVSLKSVCRLPLWKLDVSRSRKLNLSSNASVKEKYAPCSPRVFSGIQPSGVPHLGNYIGAIKKWLNLQDEYDTNDSVILSVVDLHAITVPQNPDTLRNNIYDMTACLLACGIDPEKCILFQQSAVPQHTELAWILGCMCTLPRLQHLPQYKEKSAKLKDVGVGLFTYPILQAADILLYKSTLVPVGEDQVQHIELARYLARTFNRKAGLLFPNPREIIGNTSKIRSLRNPTCKMSKSDGNANSSIGLMDSPDDIRSKIKKAVTDFTSAVTYDPIQRPGVSNLVEIHSTLTEETPEEICESVSMLTTAEYKLKLADIVIDKLSPIRQNYERLIKDRHHIETVLEMGRVKASNIAESTFCEVQNLVGMK